MFRSFLSVAAALFLLSAPAQAQGVEKYTLDNPHTQIVFSVSHMGFSHSVGKFLGYDGGFTFDRANPQNSTIDVTIDTASIDLGTQKWNDHMKNADFFDVEKYPTMTFKSTGVVVTGENTADITGDLTLLGVTKPVTLNVVHNKSGPRPSGEQFVAGFSATAKIKRSDFGMNYGIGMIGDEIDIRIEVEGNQVDYKGAAKE